MWLSVFNSFGQTPPYVWVDGAYSSVDEFANDVAVDTATGNVVAVGIFNSDLSAFYGAKFVGAVGGGFVVNYDPNGNVIWAFPIGNNQDDACNGVAIDASGNIYVTGYVQNVADVKGMLSGAPIYVNSAGGKDIFIVKYNSAGQLLWSNTAGGTGEDEGLAICVNSSGAFITGYFNGSSSFGSFVITGSSFNDNAYVAGYNVNTGASLWVAASGAVNTAAYGRGICADNNGVFVIGDFTGTVLDVTNSSGVLQTTIASANFAQRDIFVTSYSNTGAYNWARPIQSTGIDIGHDVAQLGNNIYVSGATSANANFPSYASNPVAAGASGFDMFVAQLKKSNGNTNWVNSETGVGAQDGMSINVNPLNGVYVTGYFNNTMTFAGTTSITSVGMEDVFTAGYDTLGIFKWVKQGGDVKSDFALGVASKGPAEIYFAGIYTHNAVFNPFTLSSVDAFSYNILTGKIGCAAIGNNTITAAQTICQGLFPALLNGSSPAGGTSPYNYLWQQGPNNISWSAAGGTNNTQNYSPPALLANTYYRRVVTSTGGCNNSDTSSSILITVNQKPTTANAGIDSSICNASINMFANAPVVGTATWTLVSGTGTIVSANSATTSVNSMATGLNVFAWTISNGVCPSTSDTVTIKVYALPTTSAAGADQSICASTYTLNANTPLVGTGLWSVIAGSATVTSVSSPNSAATGLSTGQNIFVWTISNGSCTSSKDTVVIKVDAPPSISFAGNDQTLCVTTYTLNANAPGVGTGIWNVLSGGSTVVSPTQNNSVVNGLSIGVNNLEWVLSNGSCAASKDTVSITVNPILTISAAGSDQSICSSTYTLNANNPVVGSGTWSVIAGSATVTSVSSPNSAASGLSTGQNIFVWTISSGFCTSSKDTVVITVDAIPSISFAGNNQTICAATYTLNASVPGVGTGSWNVLSGGSTVVSPSQNNSVVNGLSVGLNNLEWIVSNGSCPSSRDTVTITVNAMPSSFAGNNQTICASSYTLNASPPAIGTGSWTVYSGGATVVSSGSANSAVNNLSNGNNIFIWTVTNGVCPSASDSVTIRVDAMPTVASAGNPQTLCNDSTLLNANPPVVGIATWSVVSGGATLANASQNNSLAYNLSVGSNIFMWSISNGVCPVSTSTVVITVDANPSVAFAGANQSVCSTSFALNATAPSTGNGNWSVLLGGSTVATPTANATNANGLSIGINSFLWTVTNGTCPASTDTVFIAVDANPSQADAGNPQTLCVSSTNLNAVLPVTGTGIWNVLSGGATVTSPTLNNSLVNGLSIGLNSIEWVVSNGSCNPSRDTVYIMVDANPSIANAGANQTLCNDSSALLANTPVVGTGAWTAIAGGGTASSPNQPATIVFSLTTGQNIFVWTISNGTCPSSTDTVVINIDAMPSLANAGLSQNVCSTTANLNAVAPAVGNGTWTVTQGASSVISVNNNNSAVSGLSPGVNTFQWTVSNGTCPSNSDTVVINLNAPPSNSNAGSDQTVCSSVTSLAATMPAVGTGNWSVFSGGATIGSPNSVSTTVGNLTTGQNIFVWTVSNGACPSSSDTVVVTVSPFPSVANAGADQNVCGNSGSALLNAVNPVIGNGIWVVISGSGMVNNTNQFNSGVNGLSLGQNTFVWTVSNSLCPSSKDTVNIFVFPNPTTANAGSDITINGPNSNLSGNVPVLGTGNWALVSGSGNISNPTNASTAVTGLSFGDNVFSWTISNGVCPNSFDEVIIHMNDLVVPNGFSPNGDHVNDTFEIPGIDLFSNIKLEVFNRWGNLVYENNNYKNDWDGKNLSGDELTDDTYYFVLKVTAAKTYKDFVVLKRK